MKKTKDGKPMDFILFPKDSTPEEMMDMLEEAGFIPKNWRDREPKKQKGATRSRSQ